LNGILQKLLVSTLSLAFTALAGPLEVQQSCVFVRGEELTLHHYPALSDSDPPRHKILLVSGDGGWKGFEKKMATTMASWGYDVCGLNSRQYLRSFTGTAQLTKADVMEDVHTMADFIAPDPGEKVVLMGWSEGAALVVLAAASHDNKGKVDGVVAVSLPESGILSWHWIDNFAFLPWINEKGPFFSAVPYVPEVAPLPLVIIQSSHDKYVPAEDADKLFSVAIKPSRRIFLHAGGHSFPGNRKAFFRELRKGLTWIETGHTER
jgi:pimeloyl-ACP methyl ester carboxylesterase